PNRDGPARIEDTEAMQNAGEGVLCIGVRVCGDSAVIDRYLRVLDIQPESDQRGTLRGVARGDLIAANNRIEESRSASEHGDSASDSRRAVSADRRISDVQMPARAQDGPSEGGLAEIESFIAR